MESKLENIQSVTGEGNEEVDNFVVAYEAKKIPQKNGDTGIANETKTSEKPFRQPTVPLHLRTLRATIYVLNKALNIGYVPLFIYRVFERRNKCTPVTDPILRIPAVELARKIRRKQISCEHVIQAYISRIKEVNPLLNAVIDERFADALEDAKRVDKLVSSEDFMKNEHQHFQNYPLLGVPLTVKGSLAVKDLKHTSGTVTRKELKAENDADSVALARKAGAIPLLVSNVPELCMNWETTNKVHGTTNNPHDTTRTCGGSSGGEASLLGSGASLLGIGSDVAGSLRLPAHYCGVWGHKPTPGAVSFDGHYPDCLQREKWESVFAVGPMSRYAIDLRTFLEVISVPEKRERLDLHKKIDIKNLKVFYSEYEDFYWQKPNKNCKEAVQKVVGHFRNICDFEPKKANFYLLENADVLASVDILTVEDIDDTFDGNGNGVYSELFRYTTFRSKQTFMSIACGLLRKMATSLSEKQKTDIKKFLAKMRKEYEEMLGDNGVIVLPTIATEAPKHGDILRNALSAGYLSLFNALGFPVTNCPVGVTKNGLPIGVQVVSLPYGDRLTLTVAEELEKAFGGWIEPKAD